jgi:hypothetical protein
MEFLITLEKVSNRCKLEKLSDSQILQDSITPEVLGIFWLTDSCLTERPHLFNELDYFCNGLLTRYQTETNNAQKKNFFVSKSYGAPLFLGQFQNSSNIEQEDFNQFMYLSKSLNSDKKTILLINLENTKYQDWLTQNFSEYNFLNVELSD